MDFKRPFGTGEISSVTSRLEALVHLSGGAVLLVELKSKKNFIHPRDLRIRVI